MVTRNNMQNIGSNTSCPYGLILRCRSCHCPYFEQTLWRGTWEKVLIGASAVVILATILEIAGTWDYIAELIWGMS